MTTLHFGVFGTLTVEVDENGFVEVPVIVQESGLFVGAPPAELRISEMGFHSDTEYNRQRVAQLNRRTDLPFYLATAKVKITSPLEKVTDEMLESEGIEPLPNN